MSESNSSDEEEIVVSDQESTTSTESSSDTEIPNEEDIKYDEDTPEELAVDTEDIINERRNLGRYINSTSNVLVPNTREYGVITTNRYDLILKGVYLITTDTNYLHNIFKIGVANDIFKRMKSLQTGSTEKLWLYGFFPIDTKRNMLNKEVALHRTFASYQRRGEWYKIDNLGFFINDTSFKLYAPPFIEGQLIHHISYINKASCVITLSKFFEGVQKYVIWKEQRILDKSRVKQIYKYFLNSINQIGTIDIQSFLTYIYITDGASHHERIILIDGQHRLKALEKVYNFVNSTEFNRVTFANTELRHNIVINNIKNFPILYQVYYTQNTENIPKIFRQLNMNIAVEYVKLMGDTQTKLKKFLVSFKELFIKHYRNCNLVKQVDTQLLKRPFFYVTHFVNHLVSTDILDTNLRKIKVPSKLLKLIVQFNIDHMNIRNDTELKNKVRIFGEGSRVTPSMLQKCRESRFYLGLYRDYSWLPSLFN